MVSTASWALQSWPSAASSHCPSPPAPAAPPRALLPPPRRTLRHTRTPSGCTVASWKAAPSSSTLGNMALSISLLYSPITLFRCASVNVFNS